MGSFLDVVVSEGSAGLCNDPLVQAGIVAKKAVPTHVEGIESQAPILVNGEVADGSHQTEVTTQSLEGES